jgi:hypothetical protein
MPPYAEEQFIEVSVKVLSKLKIAHIIGKAVWDQRRDIRDVISIGKLVRNNDGPEEVEQIICISVYPASVSLVIAVCSSILLKASEASIAASVELILVGFLISISTSIHLEPFLLRYRPILQRPKYVKGVNAVKPLQTRPINFMKIKVAIYDGNPVCNNQKQVHTDPQKPSVYGAPMLFDSKYKIRSKF